MESGLSCLALSNDAAMNSNEGGRDSSWSNAENPSAKGAGGASALKSGALESLCRGAENGGAEQRTEQNQAVARRKVFSEISERHRSFYV